MESNFDNKDFEHFVKQNADQYRMFPSEKVWEGIHNTLHTRRRWYGIGLTLLLLTTGVVTWVMLLSPADKNQPLTTTTKSSSVKKITEQKNKTPETFIIAPAKSATSSITVGRPGNLPNNLFLADVAPVVLKEETLLTTTSQKEVQPITSATTALAENILPQSPIYTTKEIIAAKEMPIATAATPLQLSNYSSKVYDESDKQKEEAKTISNENITTEKKDIYPLSIESVVNSYQKIAKRKKLTWQIYFLPTISYRKLIENKPFIANTQQIAGSSPLNYVVATNDVNEVVTHKPDIGLELGFNVRYPLGKNVKLTTGLQLNVSKYDIKAYRYQTEQARIALTNNNGSASVSTIETNYRNFESFTKADWLSNFYLSASMPVGLEVNVTNPRKTYLGIGGTIQPTYILGDRAYLLSTDFKNYAKVPYLTRKWNVSSSFEIFAGYSTGKLQWKVGPQVRYQLLSSFNKTYPVKEHLIDFGLKVGVMLK